ncbi:hypothetical protein CMUS01_12476 [Colletotrichum musicola]|uniref:Uncharacterized protein n=1 Tax=Colletotrichum musicola TaxID=2175873 RepID=A0A8H6JLL4_9PEZI|nr:hypothetical protein CMUS01_12476 [Colletotrichum musicola]
MAIAMMHRMAQHHAGVADTMGRAGPIAYPKRYFSGDNRESSVIGEGESSDLSHNTEIRKPLEMLRIRAQHCGRPDSWLACGPAASPGTGLARWRLSSTASLLTNHTPATIEHAWRNCAREDDSATNLNPTTGLFHGRPALTHAPVVRHGTSPHCSHRDGDIVIGSFAGVRDLPGRDTPFGTEDTRTEPVDWLSQVSIAASRPPRERVSTTELPGLRCASRARKTEEEQERQWRAGACRSLGTRAVGSLETRSGLGWSKWKETVVKLHGTGGEDLDERNWQGSMAVVVIGTHGPDLPPADVGGLAPNYSWKDPSGSVEVVVDRSLQPGVLSGASDAFPVDGVRCKNVPPPAATAAPTHGKRHGTPGKRAHVCGGVTSILGSSVTRRAILQDLLLQLEKRASQPPFGLDVCELRGKLPHHTATAISGEIFDKIALKGKAYKPKVVVAATTWKTSVHHLLFLTAFDRLPIGGKDGGLSGTFHHPGVSASQPGIVRYDITCAQRQVQLEAETASGRDSDLLSENETTSLDEGEDDAGLRSENGTESAGKKHDNIVPTHDSLSQSLHEGELDVELPRKQNSTLRGDVDAGFVHNHSTPENFVQVRSPYVDSHLSSFQLEIPRNILPDLDRVDLDEGDAWDTTWIPAEGHSSGDAHEREGPRTPTTPSVEEGEPSNIKTSVDSAYETIPRSSSPSIALPSARSYEMPDVQRPPKRPRLLAPPLPTIEASELESVLDNTKMAEGRWLNGAIGMLCEAVGSRVCFVDSLTCTKTRNANYTPEGRINEQIKGAKDIILLVNRDEHWVLFAMEKSAEGDLTSIGYFDSVDSGEDFIAQVDETVEAFTKHYIPTGKLLPSGLNIPLWRRVLATCLDQDVDDWNGILLPPHEPLEEPAEDVDAVLPDADVVRAVINDVRRSASRRNRLVRRLKAIQADLRRVLTDVNHSFGLVHRLYTEVGSRQTQLGTGLERTLMLEMEYGLTTHREGASVSRWALQLGKVEDTGDRVEKVLGRLRSVRERAMERARDLSEQLDALAAA